MKVQERDLTLEKLASLRAAFAKVARLLLVTLLR